MCDFLAWCVAVAEFSDNLSPQRGPDPWIAREEVKDGAEEAGGRVPPCKEHIQQVITDDLWVFRIRRKCLKEHISLPDWIRILVVVAATRGMFLRLQRQIHIMIDDLVHFGIRSLKLRWVDCPVEPLHEDPAEQVRLAGVKRVGEPSGVIDDCPYGSVPVRVQAPRGLAKEELGRRVDCQEVEKLLDVETRSVDREDADQLADVSVEEREVCNLYASLRPDLDIVSLLFIPFLPFLPRERICPAHLLSRKLRPDQRPHRRPFRPIERKYSIA